jgi:S-phase kinase-associated protein 1
MSEPEKKKEETLETETTKPTEEQGLDDDGDDEITLKAVGDDGKDGKSFKVKKKFCKLSNFVMTILKGDPSATEIEVRQVGSDTLENIVKYLNEHKGEEPPPLPCPVRSTEMAQIVSVKWDAEFIDAFDKKAIFEIILGANYMDIKSLLHLGCAKIATLIKKLDQKEINRIIEEEEKWQKEHGGGDKTEETKDES